MSTKLLLPLCLTATTLTACSLAPAYVRPSAPVTKQWPVASAAQESGEQPRTTDIGWRSMFRSPKLQSLIEASLANNRDLRIATLNIEAARNTYRIQRSNLLPSINASGSFTRQDLSTSRNDSGKTEITSA